jgi:hypothetical protein
MPFRIKSLEDLSLGHRIALTFAIIVIVLLLLACIGFLSGRWEVEAEPDLQIYQGIPLNEQIDVHLVRIDKEALDLAYKDHLKVLFSVWLRDDVSTVSRINNGLRIARRAYTHAIEQIDKRERALPPH